MTEENKKEYVRYCRTNTYPAYVVEGGQLTHCFGFFLYGETNDIGISEGNT